MILKRLFFTPVVQKARWEAWRFDRCCRRVKEVQQAVLAEKIATNGDSAMGRTMGIPSIGSVEQFRSRLPVTTYEEYVPAIEKCKAGDSLAMVGPGQKIVLFALSSGTTGQTKFIPITEKFLKEYRRGWLIWGYHAYRGRPILVGTYLLPITSCSCEFLSSGGIPCGAISGCTTDSQSWITRHLFPVPRQAYQIKDPQAKYYVLGRFAIEKRIGSISSANPSTVLSLFRLLNAKSDKIISDVRSGSLDPGLDLPADLRAALERYLKPNPNKADELAGMVEAQGGLYPKDFWPDLTLISNWKGGSLCRYLDFYPEFFGNTEVRDIGLIASEGRMTIPLSASGSEGVLDVASHFFEFVPEDAIADKVPRTYLAHELEKGRRYFLLLTTSSGLYRYDIRDLVEVTGYYHQAPVLRFLNKGKHFSSITGEKISEYQVVQAVQQVARSLRLALEHYCVFPKWGKIPYYGVLVEEDFTWPRDTWGRFLKELDDTLRRLNCEYDSKRASGRLGAMSMFFVPAGTFERVKQEKLVAQGGRVEQYKHVFLTPSEDLDKVFPVLREFSIGTVAQSRVP